MAGASALGAGALIGGGLLVPVAGIGLGLAAGALHALPAAGADRPGQQARLWLREVLGEARAALSDEIMHRFTDLQYALTLALDDAIERRLQQLDAHIAEIDKALAEDKAERARRRAAAPARAGDAAGPGQAGRRGAGAGQGTGTRPEGGVMNEHGWDHHDDPGAEHGLEHGFERRQRRTPGGHRAGRRVRGPGLR